MNTTSLQGSEKYTTQLTRSTPAALSLAVMIALALIATPAMSAQTLTVLHSFSGGADGANPMTGVTMDAAGDLYGTTYGGGTGFGTVFKLKHSGSAWILTPIYTFAGGNDGAYPQGRVAVAQDGTLYGTTNQGGMGDYGTVYQLRPPAAAPRSALTPWNEAVLHSFNYSDGAGPQGDLTFDQSGNIYGTTTNGGSASGGVIYELTSLAGNWTETILYSPQRNSGGDIPYGGVIRDSPGNLYGVFNSGGENGSGSVYELSPLGSGWTEQILYGPAGELWNPIGGLIMDPYSNLYGTTGGSAWELVRDNNWMLNDIHDFSDPGGPGLLDKLLMDSAGNLYGTIYYAGGNDAGEVFELVFSDGIWQNRLLHTFTGGDDGGYPVSNLIFDADGNLYGTTSFGGTYGAGVVFEITP